MLYFDVFCSASYEPRCATSVVGFDVKDSAVGF